MWNCKIITSALVLVKCPATISGLESEMGYYLFPLINFHLFGSLCSPLEVMEGRGDTI